MKLDVDEGEDEFFFDDLPDDPANKNVKQHEARAHCSFLDDLKILGRRSPATVLGKKYFSHLKTCHGWNHAACKRPGFP